MCDPERVNLGRVHDQYNHPWLMIVFILISGLLGNEVVWLGDIRCP